jgi:hypothetical protein
VFYVAFWLTGKVGKGVLLLWLQDGADQPQVDEEGFIIRPETPKEG